MFSGVLIFNLSMEYFSKKLENFEYVRCQESQIGARPMLGKVKVPFKCKSHQVQSGSL